MANLVKANPSPLLFMPQYYELFKIKCIFIAQYGFVLE